MHRMKHHRSVETNHGIMHLSNRVRKETNITLKNNRTAFCTNFVIMAFCNNATIDYSATQSVAVESVNVVCPHCKPLKYIYIYVFRKW